MNRLKLELNIYREIIKSMIIIMESLQTLLKTQKEKINTLEIPHEAKESLIDRIDLQLNLIDSELWKYAELLEKLGGWFNEI